MFMRGLNNKEKPRRKKTMIIDFPSNRQSTKFSCGCCVVQSTLWFCKQEDIREDDLIKLLKATPKGGVDPDTIIKFLKKKKIEIEYGTMDIETLKDSLRKGYPVILSVQAWSDDKEIDYEETTSEGHYIVAVGLNNGGFVFEDPSIQSHHGIMDFDELEKRWHDVDRYGNEFDHFGITIKCKSKYKSQKMVKIEWYLRTIQIK
jgi:predicted double-glycine peptidase